MGRCSSVSHQQKFGSLHVGGSPTLYEFCSDLYTASVSRRFSACCLILFTETLPKNCFQLTTVASYPYVMIRASAISLGSSVFGHGSAWPSAHQVFSQWPFRPWTNTMLNQSKEKYSTKPKHRFTDSTIGFSPSANIFIPVTKISLA